MDFEEIPHAGGIVTFDNGQVSYSISKPIPVRVFGLCASYNGRILCWSNFGKINNPDPYPSIVIMVPSDSEGFWEFNCQKCLKYFRTHIAIENLGCAYCSNKDFIYEFLTENKKEYIKFYFEKFTESIRDKKCFTIDLDEISNHISKNKSNFKLSHERQQKKVKCSNTKCQNIYDILGEYSGCPLCRKRNNHDVLTEKINNLSGKPEDELDTIFEIFEGMANDLKNSILINIPCTKQRIKDIKSISFQRYNELESLKSTFGINLFKDITESKKLLFKKMMQIRHLKEHNNLIVDQKYIEETNDRTVRLGQKLKVEFKDVNILKEIIINISAIFNNSIDEILSRS